MSLEEFYEDIELEEREYGDAADLVNPALIPVIDSLAVDADDLYRI